MTIEELKQAYEAATPGPWGQNPFTPINIQLKSGLTICSMAAATARTEDGFQAELLANAHLIVAAVNNLPKLLKVAEAAGDYVQLNNQDAEIDEKGEAFYALHKALEELNNG